jgi:hypothetical protein
LLHHVQAHEIHRDLPPTRFNLPSMVTTENDIDAETAKLALTDALQTRYMETKFSFDTVQLLQL